MYNDKDAGAWAAYQRKLAGGGAVSYSSIQRNSGFYGLDQAAYDIQLSPSGGYFVRDKLALGMKLGYNGMGSRSQGGQGFNQYHDFFLAPFARYYLLPKEKIINLLIDGSYQYGFIKSRSPELNNRHSFQFQTGPVVYFNSSVGLEFLVSYTASKFSNFSGIDNTIRFGLGLQVHLEKDR